MAVWEWPCLSNSPYRCWGSPAAWWQCSCEHPRYREVKQYHPHSIAANPDQGQEGLLAAGAQLPNESSACVCSWMFTGAVTEAIVIIKDLPHSINFPKGFREPLLFTSHFMKSAGCIAARLQKAGAHTSATWLTSVPVLRTECEGVDDSSVTCGANLSSLLLFSQCGRGTGRKAEVP